MPLMVSRAILGMSTYADVVISPAMTHRPVVRRVSQATRPLGSSARMASRIGVGDLVGHLVGMAFGDAFGGERVRAHAVSCRCRGANGDDGVDDGPSDISLRCEVDLDRLRVGPQQRDRVGVVCEADPWGTRRRWPRSGRDASSAASRWRWRAGRRFRRRSRPAPARRAWRRRARRGCRASARA